GIIFIFDFESQRVIQEASTYRLVSKDKELQADAIFVATGRRPNIEHLQLEQAGVHTVKQGIVVNEYLQTSNPNIFACGEIIAKNEVNLALVATFDGTYAADYLTGKTAPSHSPVIPTIVYSRPQVAQVGQTKKQATEKDQVIAVSMTDWFTDHRV